MNGAPALDAAGNVVFSSSDGHFYVVNGTTGTLVWDLSLPTGAAAPNLGPDGTIYVADYAVQGEAGLASAPWPAFRQGPENRASLQRLEPPKILAPPAGGPVAAGSNRVLSVLALGNLPLSYQWYFQNQPLADARSAAYTVANFGTNQTGEYYVVVTNTLGGVTSAPARLYEGYTVAVQSRGLGQTTVQPRQPWYAWGSQVTLVATPASGRRFLGWSDGLGTNLVLTLTVDRNLSLVATFELLPGANLWTFTAQGAVGSSPAIDEDGTVFFGSDDTKVYALDGATGLKKWEYATGGSVVSSPAIGTNGLVYVGSSDRYVYALNKTTGSKVWAFDAAAPVTSSPALSADGEGTLFIAAGEVVYALRGDTGAKALAFAAGGAVNSSPAIAPDGTIYTIASRPYEQRALIAWDGATGRTNWIYVGETALYPRQYGPLMVSPVPGQNGLVYLGTTGTWPRFGDADARAGGRLFAVDATHGKVRWTFQAASAVESTPALGPDGTLFASDYNKMCALDAATGAQLWEYAATRFILSSPALSEKGTLYFGSDDGRLHAVNAAAGTLQWTAQTGGPVRSSPAIGPDGTVYFGSDDGKVYACLGDGPLAGGPWPKFRRSPGNRGAQDTGGRPEIAREPGSTPVAFGREIALAVEVKGAWPVFYQWYFQNQPLENATSAVYRIASFAATNVGAYHVAVSNHLGQAQSAQFRLDSGWALDVDLDGPGEVTRRPDFAAYLPGTVVTLSAAPKGARRFLRWSGDLEGTNVQITFTVNRNLRATAKFRYLTGEKMWVKSMGLLSTLSLGQDGTLYVADKSDLFVPYFQTLHALDARAGLTRWTAGLTEAGLTYSSGAPVLGVDDLIYSGFGGKVRALDPKTRTGGWLPDALGSGLTPQGVSVALGPDGTVYATFGMYAGAWRGPEGNRKWARTFGVGNLSSPVIGRDGTVYLCSSSNLLYALDGSNGATTWVFPLKTSGSDSVVALGADGTVFASSTDANLYALDGKTGTKQWTFPAGAPLVAAPAVGTNGTVFLAAKGAYAIAGASGAPLWSFPTGDGTGTPAVGADGVVYVAAGTNLYALEGTSGTRLWSYPFPGNIGSPVLGPDGAIYEAITVMEYDPSIVSGTRWYGMLYAIQGSAGLAASSWPMADGNAQHSGHSPLTAPPAGTFPSLSAFPIADGAFRLEIHGLAGSRWQVERSEDLRLWIQIGSPLAMENDSVSVTIPVSDRAQAFFRVVSAP